MARYGVVTRLLHCRWHQREGSSPHPIELQTLCAGDARSKDEAKNFTLSTGAVQCALVRSGSKLCRYPRAAA